MLKTLDRYLIRETVLPFCLGLAVLTFILVIPPILRDGEALIAKGVAWPIIGRVLLTLLPSALSLTIPMAVLLGILVALGRMSGDRELVALQACGISILRLLRPIAVIGILGVAATAYEIIVALPDANQTFQQIKFNVVANRAESSIAPQVFFDEFTGRTLYIREVLPDGGWRGVFLADTSTPDRTTVYFAEQGRLIVNRNERTVVVELINATRHTTIASRPDEYEGGQQARVVLSLDPSAMFPKFVPIKGAPEMTIAELRQSIAEATSRGVRAYDQAFMIGYKFAVPVAALVLGLIGLALGVSYRRDGRLASFVLGFGVIFVYYVLLWTARAVAISGWFPAVWAPWMPNVAFATAGVLLLRWRAGAGDQPFRIVVPAWRSTASTTHARRAVQLPRVWLPRPALLDVYVSAQYLRVFCVGLCVLLGVFYIATFMDLADKLFRGTATMALLLRYFYFQTPQYVYYVIPMSALVATLVTIGVMSKNSELIIIRACGVSLYRTAAPLLFFGVLTGLLLFGIQEQVLASSNREADRLNRLIRGLPAQRLAFDRRWVVGEHGDIYHYGEFDQRLREFTALTIYGVRPDGSGLTSITHAERVTYRGIPEGDQWEWKATNGWSRAVAAGAAYAPFSERTLRFEPPDYFTSEEPDAAFMTYVQLDRRVAQLRSRGGDATAGLVGLQRKLAFPFVTLVMTLIAVPFAVTTGRRGALYGIGIGIVLAILYWLTMSIFGAMGAGGLLSPTLAAWSPNILFGAVAIYMLLTVRT